MTTEHQALNEGQMLFAFPDTAGLKGPCEAERSMPSTCSPTAARSSFTSNKKTTRLPSLLKIAAQALRLMLPIESSNLSSPREPRALALVLP